MKINKFTTYLKENNIWIDPYRGENLEIDEGVKWYNKGKFIKDDNWNIENPYIDDLIDDDDFVKFLQEHDALEKFKNNYVMQHPKNIEKSFKEIYKNARTRYIDVALTWTQTKEGSSYWGYLNDLWYKHVKK